MGKKISTNGAGALHAGLVNGWYDGRSDDGANFKARYEGVSIMTRDSASKWMRGYRRGAAARGNPSLLVAARLR